MKKGLLTIAIVIMAMTAQAQLKLHSDNWLSLGSLDQSYGMQITPNGYTYHRTRISTQYSWAIQSVVNAQYQKHWIVSVFSNGATTDLFYVYGNGSVYSTNQYTITSSPSLLSSKPNLQMDSEPINGELALSTILNLNGYYNESPSGVTIEEIETSEYVKDEAKASMIEDLEKRSVSLSVESLLEVFPDAVRTDPEARLCIDYNAVITMLVEAVKQQQVEIQLLQKVLEENGLMEK